MVIDRATAFYLRPLDDESAQSASKVLDFGAAERSGANNFGGYLNVVTSAASGSVKLQDSANGTDFADVPGSTITVSAAGAYSIKLPKHRQFVKAVLTTVTASNTDVFIGGVADNSLI